VLTHTSGIDGDFFQDTGRWDDCVERYILACSGLGQLHQPDALFSYCNAGFVIAGRIVEKLRRTTWDQALRHYVLDPVGGPAGATPFAAARDLLRFARLHLAGGETAAGKRLLSAGSVAAMRH